MRGMSKTTRHCIEECLRCYQTCLGTAMMHCLESGGEHVAPAHFRLMMSCAEICRSAAHEMLVGGTHAGRLCGLCVDVCEQYAEDCERIGDMAECVDECRRCASACRRMAGEDQGAKVGHEAAHQRH